MLFSLNSPAHVLYTYAPIADASKCYYCARHAEGMDHVLPQSLAYALPYERWPPELLQLVPCCRQCNSIAGDWLFLTLASKKRYIAMRLDEMRAAAMLHHLLA